MDSPSTRRADSPVVETPDRKSKVRGFFNSHYEFFLQVVDFIKNVPKIGTYWPETSKQIDKHIAGTLPLAMLVGCFVGIGASLQGKDQAAVWVGQKIIVNIIFKFGIIELCPFILGLVMAGKIGAAVAAEVGSMKITEQIDALKTMSIHPTGYLGWPRVAAAMIMLPVITIFADICAVLSMIVISLRVFFWVSPDDLLAGMRENVHPGFLIVHMIIKPAIFGLMISFIGYFFGSKTRQGSKGVGQASTQAAVVSSLVIVTLNYLIKELSH